MNEYPANIAKPKWSADTSSSETGTHRRFRQRWSALIFAAVLIFLVLAGLTDYIEKWLWMRQLDYSGIFWTLLSVRCAMFSAAFVFAFVYLWLNLRPATKESGPISGGDRPWSLASLSKTNADTQTGDELPPRLIKAAVVLVSGGVALFFALGFYSEWDTYLRFRYGGFFGVSDPLFGVDVGFYLFHLPFYELLQSSLATLTVLTLAIVLLAYGLFGTWRIRGSRGIVASGSSVAHVSVILFILVATLGWGFYLDHYELVYSTLGVVYGAGYAADHVTRVALWSMVGISAVACALLALNIFRPRFMTLAAGAGVYVVLWIFGVSLAPYFFQKFFVQPSELALETPYLKNYIDFTRKAFQLDGIKETSYPSLADLTPAVIARNQDTIQNIRLWDSRPLLQT
ncbi:UPF0182 family protein, partial [Bradyrhizobium sp.]|uniref:UPF0182 family protein n=1 Tax=Bradyrhizobium sp. TaxID=376 RepID=UPI003C218B56